MTVKISNEKIYIAYKYAINKLTVDVVFRVYRFWDKLADTVNRNNASSTEFITEAQVVAQAIINREPAELEEKQYYVSLAGAEHANSYLNIYIPNSAWRFSEILEIENWNVKFTNSWLKENWKPYDQFRNAGLLEFEEVEDD